MIRASLLQILAVVFFLFPSPPAEAKVALPSIFGDHMVLQQGIEIPIWGTGEPGEKITVSTGAASAEAVANERGKWRAQLGPLEKTSKPITLTIKGENEIVIQDVLVGEVWVCSGQSNMAFGLKNAHNASVAIPKADHPEIRFFKVASKIALSPEEDCRGSWIVCTPESAADFSAVGYFFGEQIQKEQNAPVGLIGTYVGGTPAQAWTSLQALEAVPNLAHYAKRFQETQANLPKLKEIYAKELLPKWTAEMEAWKAGPGAKATGKAVRGPKKPVAPDNDRKFPTVLFNGMVSPIIPYAIKGVIWYQGEANVKAAAEYATLFPTMIKDWRPRWGEGDFPFLFVQIASYGKSTALPILRDSQRKTLALPKTGMAMAIDTIDIGEQNDVHPKNKLDIGRRLALAARAIAYGEDIVYSGPTFKSRSIADGKVRVAFDHVGGGLVIGSAPPIRLEETPAPPLDHLVGFEIAGKDGKFVPAKAEIDGNSVVVWNESVPEPNSARYGWAPVPEVNLYNKEGLPAAPFTSASESKD